MALVRILIGIGVIAGIAVIIKLITFLGLWKFIATAFVIIAFIVGAYAIGDLFTSKKY